MKKTNIRRLAYHIRHHYLTMNNVVVAVALVIGASWAWGSIEVMQRNYNLQKQVDAKLRQQKLVELQAANLSLEQKYYRSGEYQELAVRERLGLVQPGEKVLILPPNTEAAKNVDTVTTQKPIVAAAQPTSNFEQWMNFLFGGAKER